MKSCDIAELVLQLVNYALKAQLIEDADKIWALNSICAKLKIEGFEFKADDKIICDYPDQILSAISAWAAANKIISNIDRDIFETDLISTFLQRPSDFERRFFDLAKRKNMQAATDWMYQKQKQAAYIKAERIKKNIVWKTKTEYGFLDLTINLAKPEKTPQEIAQIVRLNLPKQNYPKCVLCIENEGFCGNAKYPSKQNLRLIALKLNGEDWSFQFSPYVYYNQHCIVLSNVHTNMKIDQNTFV
ncbi:MAG: galactose-1-phosphate uridylyltransferase, partial [Elusimicrobiota bacterium]|nr:galactose-1-phosphate uridylyltransferase [Elusimicrobiota bacterium]